MKRLEVIRARHNHTCASVECGAQIKRNAMALALVTEEVVDGNPERWILWFCDVGCYNDYEYAFKYSASAAIDF
jgi:hypothetical protein